jgi:ribose-phosphate pyrophosphokinase
VVVSPDLGGVADCRIFAEMLNVPLAIVDKRRPRDNESEVMHFIGNVEGKNAILLDEVVTTAGTLTNAAKTVKDHGANAVYACVTHPVLCGDAISKLRDSVLEELVVTNTIYVPDEKRLPKITVLNVAKYFGDAIDCIHSGKSISRLFK